LQFVLLAMTNGKRLAYVSGAIGALTMLTNPSISSIKSKNATVEEQGTVQGAMFGTKALAQGFGPLLFAGIFRAFSTTDRMPGLPFYPGAPFVLGAGLMVGAMYLAYSLPRNARAQMGGPAGGISNRSGDVIPMTERG
jgi:MFS transporter, DHA1 family, tetracycline resistance protein